MIGNVVVSSVPEWVGDATVWLGLLLTFAAFCGVAWRAKKSVLKSFTGAVEDVVDRKLVPVFEYQGAMTTRVEGLVTTIDDVQAQLHPNAGTSMRDQINRIGEKVGVEHSDSHPPRSGKSDTDH